MPILCQPFRISVNLDLAVYGMFDTMQDLGEMIELVPEWQKPEAVKIKRRIVNRMADWLNGED
jgi:hypothetical protein